MKRLIRKSEESTPSIPEVGEDIRLQDDPKFANLDMSDLSIPQNRDGAVLVDTKANKVYMGTNGKTHAELLSEYYDIPLDNDDTKLDIDSYVAPGVYLNNFLGKETIILYSNVFGAEDVISSQMPGTIVYAENWDFEETIMRLARKY